MQRRRYKRYEVSPVFTQFGLSWVSWEKSRVGVKIRAGNRAGCLTGVELVLSFMFVLTELLKCVVQVYFLEFGCLLINFPFHLFKFLYREGNPDLITF